MDDDRAGYRWPDSSRNEHIGAGILANVSLNEVYKAIGSLESDVKGLTRMIEDQNTRSSESRGRMHDQIEAVAKKTDEIERRVGHTEAVVADIEPLARDFGAIRERSKGVIATIILAWTLIGGLLMWAGNNILEWIAQRLQGP